MKSPTYCHTIRFRGSAHPMGRYQLQISEVSWNGQPLYRAQWDFPTLRTLLTFLQRHFPDSQALAIAGHQPSTFDAALSLMAV